MFKINLISVVGGNPEGTRDYASEDPVTRLYSFPALCGVTVLAYVTFCKHFILLRDGDSFAPSTWDHQVWFHELILFYLQIAGQMFLKFAGTRRTRITLFLGRG